MGIARLLTCIAEVPAFRMSGQILKLLGVSGSFALAQVAYIVRFLYYVNLRAIAKLGPWGECQRSEVWKGDAVDSIRNTRAPQQHTKRRERVKT